MHDPNRCDCCTGVKSLTPVAVLNAPGQTALAYRVGTHGRFLQTQLAALAGQPALAGLSTREPSDPAIALIDAWSAVLDVLGFYQERIANENYLRTATERRSVLEMARSIGYELRPGVAASVHLAFNLETSPGAPLAARIDAGTATQSVPAQDEAPQVFETLETLDARAAWNAMGVVRDITAAPYWGGRTLWLAGQNTRLQPGDALLVVGDERAKDPGNENWDIRRVARVLVLPPEVPSADPQAGTTIVTLDRGLGSVIPSIQPALANPRCYALRTRASLFGQAAPDWRAMPVSLRAATLGSDKDSDASIVTHPQWPGYTIADVSNWPKEGPVPADKPVHLDAAYPRVLAGSWVVLSIPGYDELYEVLDTRDDGLSAFTLSSKSTRLTLRGEQLAELFNNRLRDTAVHAESVELPWALRPVSGLVSGKLLMLDSAQPDLPDDRWLALSGHTLDPQNPVTHRAWKRLHAGDALAAVQVVQPPASNTATVTLTFLDGEVFKVPLTAVNEVVQLRHATVVGAQTQLELHADLTQHFLPATLRINANVVAASHGDSQQRNIQPEVLGSGDGAAVLQRFELRGKPLTHISAATPSGTRSSLEVRVDDVAWPQVERLADLGPADRGYIARQADDGTVTVQFGDGLQGQRLPSGVMNLRARYRVGIGLAGNVAAGQISQLRTRALGVKEVFNPLPAAGAADPEARDEARRNAPLAVRTLDRIVSLSDFEDFASAFAGIGKAQAGWLWDGEGRLVQLTVSGVDGKAIEPQSTLALNLRAAIDAARPAHQALVIAPALVLRFGLSAGVRVLPGYETPAVLAAVRTALAGAFGFAQRAYAQSLAASQVLDVMQHTAGVDWIDLDELRLLDDTPAHHRLATERGPDARLRARGARWESGAVQPAQLLLILPADILLTEITAEPAP
jgi:hypothetical protein